MVKCMASYLPKLFLGTISFCLPLFLVGSCFTGRMCLWWEGICRTLAAVGSWVSSMAACSPLALCIPPGMTPIPSLTYAPGCLSLLIPPWQE